MTNAASGCDAPIHRRWKSADFQQITPVPCPCGSEDAKRHYHRRLTETYVILECGPDAAMELDGERIPVQPLQSFVIPPGVRHRAVGRMKVLIVVLPEFDPADEWFD